MSVFKVNKTLGMLPCGDGWLAATAAWLFAAQVVVFFCTRVVQAVQKCLTS